MKINVDINDYSNPRPMDFKYSLDGQNIITEDSFNSALKKVNSNPAPN